MVVDDDDDDDDDNDDDCTSEEVRTVLYVIVNECFSMIFY
jgi:hypothetical protein